VTARAVTADERMNLPAPQLEAEVRQDRDAVALMQASD